MKVSVEQFASIIKHDLEYFSKMKVQEQNKYCTDIIFAEFEDWEEEFISWLGSHYPNESKHRKSN